MCIYHALSVPVFYHIYGKVKLKSAVEQDMKAQKGRRVIALLFL